MSNAIGIDAATPTATRGGASNLPYLLILVSLVLFAIGSWFGLVVAPPEQYMGETQRIMYIHVPTAWGALLLFSWAFICAIAFLMTGKWKWDSRLEASIEMAILLSFLLCMQGSIWAKPTWGVWWDWDPRLTTMAVLLFGFLGIAALRHFVDAPMKRATWSSVATVVGYVDVPIVYFSVRWWNSLHQQQSKLSTVSKDFLRPLMSNGFGMLILVVALLILRTRMARRKLRDELAPPPAGSTVSVKGGLV